MGNKHSFGTYRFLPDDATSKERKNKKIQISFQTDLEESHKRMRRPRELERHEDEGVKDDDVGAINQRKRLPILNGAGAELTGAENDLLKRRL